MCGDNTFVMLIEPLSEAGLRCVRLLDSAGILLVGAVGRETGAGEDVGLLAGTRPTGFDVQDPAMLPKLAAQGSPDAVIDCSGDICWSAPLLEACAEAGLPVLIAGAPTRTEHGRRLLAGLEELAGKRGARITVCRSVEQAVRRVAALKG